MVFRCHPRGGSVLGAFIASLLFSLPSFAQTSGSEGESKLKISNPSEMALETSPEPPKKSFLGQIRFESMQYMSEIPESPHLTKSQLLSARLIGGAPLNWGVANLSYGLDIAAGTYFSWGQSNFFLSEFYLRKDLNPTTDISIGRRKYDWSELDSRWQLGLWQPKYTLDALRPEDQGLTGLYYNVRQENFEFLLMGTLIFIPTMSPEIREESGELVSDSRWYRQPSNTWNFSDQPTAITYKLALPDMGSLISKPGAAAMVRMGSRKAGPRAIFSAARKPVNDLLLKRQVFFVVDNTKVTVAPDVTYHNLVSVDVGYTSGAVSGSLSLIADQPDERIPEVTMAIQKIEPVQIYSANLDFDLGRFFSHRLLVQTSYLKSYGGGIQDVDNAGNPDEITLFEDRFKFSNAAMVRLQAEITKLFAGPFISKFSYIYDFDQKGSIWGLEFQIFPAQKWALVLGADLLGVESPTDNDKGFINQFRANDRVYGGMSYVF